MTANTYLVVSGSTGFIGSHVMRLADQQGFPVQACGRKECQAALTADPDGWLPPGDVLVHLAQESHRGKVNTRPEASAQAEIAYVEMLARRYPVVVYASTAMVYGDQSGRAHPETDPVVPSDSYISAKLASEAHVLARGGTVVRLANVYGPGQRQSSVVKDLIERSRLTGIVSTSHGAPVRDFVFVEDVAAMLLAVARAPSPGIFNFGTGIGTSIANLAGMIADAMGLPVAVDSPPGVNSSIIVDARRARERWLLSDPVALEAGLLATIGESE